MSLFLLGNFPQLDEQNTENTEQIGGYNFAEWKKAILTHIKGKNITLSEDKSGKIWYIQLTFANGLIMKIISNSQNGCKIDIGHNVDSKGNLLIKDNFNYDFTTIGFNQNRTTPSIASKDVGADNFLESKLKPLIIAVNKIPINLPAQQPAQQNAQTNQPSSVPPMALLTPPAPPLTQVQGKQNKSFMDAIKAPVQPIKQPEKQPEKQPDPSSSSNSISSTSFKSVLENPSTQAPVQTKKAPIRQTPSTQAQIQQAQPICSYCTMDQPTDKLVYKPLSINKVLKEEAIIIDGTTVTTLPIHTVYVDSYNEIPTNISSAQLSLIYKESHFFCQGSCDLRKPLNKYCFKFINKKVKELNDTYRMVTIDAKRIIPVCDNESFYIKIEPSEVNKVCNLTQKKFNDFSKEKISQALDLSKSNEDKKTELIDVIRMQIENECKQKNYFKCLYELITKALRVRLMDNICVKINNKIRSEYPALELKPLGKYSKPIEDALYGVAGVASTIKNNHVNVEQFFTDITREQGYKNFRGESISSYVDLFEYLRPEISNIQGYLGGWAKRINDFIDSKVTDFIADPTNISDNDYHIISKINSLTTDGMLKKGVNGIIKKEVCIIVKLLCDNLAKGESKDKKIKHPLTFYCDIKRLDFDNLIAFDEHHNVDKTRFYDERDETNSLQDATYERLPMFQFEYQQTLNRASNIGYVSSNTLSIRSLKQHITLDPSTINYIVYSKNRGVGTQENNIVKMFDTISCLKFWFDVYVEGMFYNLIYPGKNSPESTNALLEIKKELIKRIDTDIDQKLSNGSDLKTKLETFTREINARNKSLKEKRDNLNATKMLYDIIATDQSNTSKIEEVAKLVYTPNNEIRTRLEQISRFKVDTSVINEIKKKIGKESKVNFALEFANKQILINKYINGDIFVASEQAKVDTILSKQWKISDFTTKYTDRANIDKMREANILIKSRSRQTKKTSDITDDINSIIDLKNNSDEFGKAMENTTDISRKLLTIWLNQIVGTNPIDQTNIMELKQLLLSAVVKTIGSTLSTNTLIQNILSVPLEQREQREQKVNEFIDILYRIKNEITDNSKKDALLIAIDAYNEKLKAFLSKSSQAQQKQKKGKQSNDPMKDKDVKNSFDAIGADNKIIPQVAIKTAEQPLNQSEASRQEQLKTVDIQLSEKERDDGEFALDKWQTQFIEIIKDKKSCLLTTPTGVGKTITMLTCIHGLITEFNKGDKSVSIVYVAPSVQLAIQNYANIKETFRSIKVALITESFVYEESDEQNIYVGTPTALSNYFEAKDTQGTKFTFKYGLFDEIHLILPTYARNVHDKIRIRETIKLLGRCNEQFIGASATISNVEVFDEYIKEKCVLITDKTKFVPVLQFENIDPKPVLPRLIEHVFNGDTFTPIDRDGNGDVNNEALVSAINASSHIVTTDNFFNFITGENKKFNTLPALVFEYTEIHAFSTFQEIVKKFKTQNSLNYPNKYNLSMELRKVIIKYNLKRNTEEPIFTGLSKKTNVAVKQFYNTQNETINEIFKSIRKTMIKCLNDIIKPESDRPQYVSRTTIVVTKTIKDSIIELLKFGVIDDINSTNIDAFYTNDSTKTITWSSNSDEPNYVAFITAIKTGNLTKEIKDITEAYILYTEKLASNEKAIKVSKKDLTYPSELEYYLTGAGNDNKLITNTKLATRIINNFNLITEFGKKIIEAENIALNKDIEMLYELYVEGAEYGVTCVIPTLPWFIQIEVINAIKDSHIDTGYEVGFVFTSKDMSIGIDYPLNSVIIKAPNGTLLNNKDTSLYFENILLIQMSGRCGRRTNPISKDGMVYYYGVSNYAEANGKKINSSSQVETTQTLTGKINDLSVIRLIENDTTSVQTVGRTDPSKNLFIELYKLSLSDGTKSIAINFTGLPIVTGLDEVNSWLSVYNQPIFKDIIKLDASREKVRHSLTILIKPILLLDESYKRLSELEQKAKLIDIIENIYRINESRAENITIEQINEINQIISMSLALLFEVYNTNRNIKLLLERKNEIVNCIKGLINILHSTEVALLTFSNMLISKDIRSVDALSASQIQPPASPTDKKSNEQENNFSLLSLLMSPFNLI